MAILLELAANRAIILDRVRAVDRLRLDQVDEHARPFHMPQEFVSQADAGVGAFDQAWDVGNHERAIHIELHNAEVRDFGGERVVGDFRAGPRDAAEQRAFAGVGFTHQADIGDDFQLERNAARFAFFTAGMIARGLIGSRLEAGVAFTASAAPGADHGFAERGQVFQYVAVLGIHNDRAGRHFNDQILGVPAMTLFAAAVPSALGPPLLAMRECRERINARFGDQNDAAAVAAVAAVRSAARNILLAAKADATITAPAGFDFNGDTIDEHGGW